MTILSNLRPDEVDITSQLACRPSRAPDYEGQKRVASQLARLASENPEELLSHFVAQTRKLCGADSAGISLYEPAEKSAGFFRWHHLSGTLAQFDGAATPRDYSPCGICLDRRAPILMAHPERAYAWIRDADITVPEVLLVPLQVGKEEPIGTLWIVAPEGKSFDAEDARILSELAGITSIATHLVKSDCVA